MALLRSGGFLAPSLKSPPVLTLGGTLRSDPVPDRARKPVRRHGKVSPRRHGKLPPLVAWRMKGVFDDF